MATVVLTAVQLRLQGLERPFSFGDVGAGCLHRCLGPAKQAYANTESVRSKAGERHVEAGASLF